MALSWIHSGGFNRTVLDGIVFPDGDFPFADSPECSGGPLPL